MKSLEIQGVESQLGSLDLFIYHLLENFEKHLRVLTASTFCQRYFGWSRTKTDESLFPVLKQLSAQQVTEVAFPKLGGQQA